MPVLFQITAGSVLLLLCGFIHILVIYKLIEMLRKSPPMRSVGQGVRTGALLCIALLFSHTIHIYLWAFAVWALGALGGYEAPIYFSLITYTTVGYGDVTLAPDFRIFGAMSSVTGILAFGMTTAFLVGLFSQVLDDGKG